MMGKTHAARNLGFIFDEHLGLFNHISVDINLVFLIFVNSAVPSLS